MNLLDSVDYLFNFSKLHAQAQQVALEALPVGVLVLDSERRFFYANRAFQSLFKQNGQTSNSRAYDVGLGSRLLSELRRLGGRSKIRGLFPIVKVPKEIRLNGKIIKETFHHVSRKNGTPECFVGIFEDITNQKRDEEYLHQTRRLSTLSQLIAGVAHEFNNPLAVIQTHLQVLIDEVGFAERHSSFEVIEKNIKRLSSTLQAIRSIYQESQLSTNKISAISLTPIIHGVCSSLREELQEARIALKVKVEPLSPLRVPSEQVRQLFLHLLLNAKEAILKKKPKRGWILLKAFPSQGGGVTLICQDNGIGIPKKIREKIFEPFFTTKEVGQGMGLGLALVHTTIHGLGGTIEITSREKKGASFPLHTPPPPNYKGKFLSSNIS